MEASSIGVKPEWTCLLIIDMQNAFCHEKGNVAKRLNTEPCRQIIPYVANLKKFCKSKAIPVIYTKQEHWREDGDAVRRLHRMTPKPGSHLYNRAILNHPATKGTWDSDFVEDLVPEPDDHVITKNKFSAFYQTNLEYILKVLGRSVILVTGVNTNTCVESTIRDAYHRDYDAILVSDCVAAPAQVKNLHDATLQNVDRYFGFVASSHEIKSSLAAMERSAD